MNANRPSITLQHLKIILAEEPELIAMYEGKLITKIYPRAKTIHCTGIIISFWGDFPEDRCSEKEIESLVNKNTVMYRPENIN